MAKMIKIYSCVPCQHNGWLLGVPDSEKNVCVLTGKVIENIETIPDWCPLPDAPDTSKFKAALDAACEMNGYTCPLDETGWTGQYLKYCNVVIADPAGDGLVGCAKYDDTKEECWKRYFMGEFDAPEVENG